jgi:hypothetical protein
MGGDLVFGAWTSWAAAEYNDPRGNKGRWKHLRSKERKIDGK